MGSVDKLIKALENLKVFQADASEEAAPTTKKKNEPLSNKDKIVGCNTLADCLCSPAVRAAPEFPNFVGVVIETLLSYANDKESDVRMVSDECLNRITRVLLDTNLGRLQVEFYKELKKNGPSRCVRSALWRFAELAPLIRPQKRRAFVVNLLSCVVKMAERHEEALQECLMSAMSNITCTLMSFASDAEIKAYLAPFITNLCSTSAVVRRAASTCASLIVLHSRKPVQFFNWLLVQVLDMVLPIMHSTSTENLPIMLGCLHCIRLIIPLLDNEKVKSAASMSGTDIQAVVKLDTTVMLFELVAHCLQQSHPSITTAALECYQQLLRTPTLPGFIDLILTPGSISTSVLAVSYEATMAAIETSSIHEPELAISDTDSNPPLDELRVNLALQSDFLPSELQTPAAAPGDDEDTPVDPSQSSLEGNSDPAPATSDSCSSPDGLKLSGENIGCLTDRDHPPIMYSARLLCHSFLLTGNVEDRLYADREVRVSIKSLALSCLSHIVKIYPPCICAPLFLSEHSEVKQSISDILLYSKHLDPQLQGMVALVLGNLIHAGVHSHLSMVDTDQQDIESYIVTLAELLDNDNSMGIRLALAAVKACINNLLNSSYHEKGVQLMDKVFVHSTNSYWLVRVDLLELISELDTLPLILASGARIQTMIMEELVIKLLGDSDYRVRQAAGTSLVRLVPQLFYGSDHAQQSVLLARANSQLNNLLYPFLSEYPIECPPLLHGLAFPYPLPSTSSNSQAKLATIQSSLSKVIYQLLESFSASNTQHTKLGVIHALHELSVKYPVTEYPYAWSCAPGSSCVQHSKSSEISHSTTSSLRSIMIMDELRLGSGGGPLTLVMSLLTHSSLSLDLSVHQDLLALAGNLLSGACLSALHQGQTTSGGQDKLWPGIYDRLLVPNAEKLLSHLIRLLNIYAHVLEDTSLIASSNPKAVLDAAREAITSPLKKKTGGKQESPANETSSEPPKSLKEAEKAVKSKKETLGTFNHIPFYVKLHEAVKGAHLNYKVSLSLSKMDKFTNMLHQTLTVFAQLLEIASLQEIGKCTDEILEYLKSIVVASPVATVSLVHQMLKALFGTNLSSQYEELVEKKVIPRSRDAMPANPPVVKPGLFTCCLSNPYSNLAQSLAHNPFRVESDDYHNSIYVIKRCEERKMPIVLKSGANVDKNTVGAYIRLFEPLVIKSLKMYTLSSSIHMQTEVLSLLVQLIQLRVNYCLLDNDEIFLGYVLKQVDMISEGPPSEQAGLIRCIFRLLLLLSYEKLHSKTLVVVPRIMQLCDGVMASGQNPLTHAIPALEMLVKDLFLCRSTNTSGNADTAFHDIETQREVTASMLLRLIKHTKVLGLLTIVLYQLMRESEEKWKKLSRQVIDLLLPLATTQQIPLESREGMHTLHNIFLAMSPSVYRPVDMLLKALFIQQTNLDDKASQQRWMSTVLAILRVLLYIGKEEVILSRLNELDITFDTNLMSNSFSMSTSGTGNMYTSQDSMISSSYGSIQPQEILASFLVQVLGFCTEMLHINMSCSYITESSYSFSLQQFSLLLLYTSYMLQSGHFRKVAKFMMEQLSSETSHLYHLVMKINMYLEGVGAQHPTISLQWSYILMLLNFNDQIWWKRTLKTPSDSDPDCSRLLHSMKLPINQQIIKCAGLAMYCDYVVENIHDAEHLTWLTVNHVNDIIDQLHEAPVHDFMSAVYGNSSASGLFISAIQSRYKMDVSPSKLHNVVTSLRSMHKDQSGLVMVLLVEKMLSAGHSGISRLADSVACRRVEVLLAEDEDTIHKQLSVEDVTRILVILQSNKRKHRRLLALAEKLRARFYPTVIPPPAFNDSIVALAPTQLADKEFYLYITKLVCNNALSSPKLCASLLASLEAPDILSIMQDSSFQVRYLAECIQHGANKSVRTDTGTVIPDGAATSHDLPPLFTASDSLLKDLWKRILPSVQSDTITGSLDESTSLARPSLVIVDVVLATSAYLVSCSTSSLNELTPSELQAICGMSYSYFDRIKVSGSPMMQSSHMMFSWTSQVEEVTPQRAPDDMCQLYAHLSLLAHILKQSVLSVVFAANHAHVFTVIDSITYILRILGVTGLTPELENYRETLVISQDGYIQVSQLVTCLSDVLLAGNSCLPTPLITLLNFVIIGLARLPCVNEHARMPVSAFVLSSEPRDGNKKPQLKVDALQDTTVLREFIKRNNLLGWISRPQFEETWACLLHLLSPVAVIGVEDVAEEEDVENIEWMVSALRGITGLLCQTLNREEPGNPLHTCYVHQHRQKPVESLHSTVIGQKLQQIRRYLEKKCTRSCECLSQTELFCSNIERVFCNIGYNQLSVDYLTRQLSKLRLPSLLMSDIEKADVEQTEKSSAGHMLVDTASCLKLLIDVYSHLLSPNAKPKTSLMLLNECVKSTVMLSDLFYEKAQYDWMYSTLWNLLSHHSGEDELMNQYIILGLCKAAAMHSIEAGGDEKLYKLVETSLKSTHIPTRLAAVYGSLYLLESALDQVKSLLPVLLEFIQKTLSSLSQKSLVLPELYSLSIWSLTFYMVEHYQEHFKSSPGFVSKVVQAGVQFINNCESNCTRTLCSVILNGFERALLTNSISKQEGSLLLKLASDKLALPAMHAHLQSVLGLLVTCMYTDQPETESDTQMSMSEDKMEIISMLFDRVRRGLPQEAEIITGILPTLMSNLFASQDIMNKVIGEFLSEQQPHLILIARMVYEVFEQQATATGGPTLLQDWVLLSITSFTQRNPLAAAVWSLTCFFVSASSNHWLRGLFPFISSRIGLLEPVDETIFLLSCKDFYNSVASDSQRKQTMISVFQSAARNEQIYKTALDDMLRCE